MSPLWPAGHYLTSRRSVFVVLHSQLIMPLPVLMVVIRLFATMRSEILLLSCLMSEVCPNVATEPIIPQPVTNERFFHRSANTGTDARLDVRAQGFWGIHHQQAYFDVRVFSPLATSNRQSAISTCFRSHNREKRRVYEQLVRDVERGSFTPLVFSALGSVSRPTEITYKRLASLLATKRDQPYITS